MVTTHNCTYTNYGTVQELRIYEGPVQVRKGFRMKPESFKRMWKVVEYIDHLDGNKVKKVKLPTEHYDPYKDRLNQKRSYRRSMQMYFSYAFSNPWRYFITFTFNRNRVNRYDYKECYKAFNNWVKWYRKRIDPTLELLVVMEYHKDGAVHFHALANCEKAIETYDDGLSNQMFAFYRGRTDVKAITATPQKVVNYISKYMVKSKDKNARRYHIFGKFRKAITIQTEFDYVESYARELLTGGYDVYIKRLDNSVVIKAYTNYDLEFHRLTNVPEYVWKDYKPKYEQLSLAF